LVVELKTVMAVDVAFPFREQITKDRAECLGMDAGVEVRDDPAPDGSDTVRAFLGQNAVHGILPAMLSP